MIVERMTFPTKPGRMQEMVEILQNMWKLMEHPPTHRIYRSITGPFNTIYQDIEFEDFETRAKFWADISSRPGFSELMEKWREGNAGGGANDFLRVVE